MPLFYYYKLFLAFLLLHYLEKTWLNYVDKELKA